MTFKIGAAVAAFAVLALTATPTLARNGLFGGAPRYIPNDGGFHRGYGEHYGFNRGFERGGRFGFYSYPSFPYFASPCYGATLNPYRCAYAYPYQYGY